MGAFSELKIRARGGQKVLKHKQGALLDLAEGSFDADQFKIVQGGSAAPLPSLGPRGDGPDGRSDGIDDHP